MALATRELELVIIARDRASAVLARIGGAFAILGAGAARIGAQGIGFFAEVTNEAIEFRRQVALAFTQAEIAGLEFNDVLKLIRDTARNSAVPVEDLTEATFDIFSTITLDNIEQAQGLLETAAMSATAGQAPIRDITRAMLGWLNALEMTPTVENASLILDRQFELVRKGAGTYTEFADVIGVAIPAFVSAGQGVDELSATIAFLSRNAMSAGESSAAARRGIELLYSPKAIKGLRNLGIEVEDGNGNFRLMDDLLKDLVKHFEGLSDAERKLEFQEIFGTGSIQARRFFDTILAPGNFDELLAIFDEIRGSGGAVADAFDIMTAEPAVQLDMLKNRFKILRQEIGDAFIPFLTGRLFPVLDQLFDWWENLDEIQRNNLVRWAAFATVWLTIAGTLGAMLGTFILFVGLLQAFTGSLALTALLGGGIVTVIAGIAAAIALAIVDWDTFVRIFGPWWETIQAKMQPVVDWIQTNWPAAWAVAEAAYQSVRLFFEEDWPVIWQNAKTAVQGFFDYWAEWYNVHLREPVENFVGFVNDKWTEITAGIAALFDGLWQELKPIWDAIVAEFGPTLEQLGLTMISIAQLIAQLAAVVVGAIVIWWNLFGELIVNQVATFVEVIGGVIRGLLQVIEGGTMALTGLLSGDLGMAWEGAKTAALGGASIIGTAWEGIWDTAGNVVENLKNTPGNLEQTVTDMETMFGGMGEIVGGGFRTMDEETATAVTNMNDSILSLNFNTLPSMVGGAMANMQSFYGNGLGVIESQTSSSLSVIEARWRDFQRRVQSNMWSVHNTFPVMNPGAPYSPPMTEQIEGSLLFIRKAFSNNFRAIQRNANQFGMQFRDQLSAYTVQPSLALASVGVVPHGPATSIGTQIDRQVTVDKVISQADPLEIASAIAWQAMNS